LTFRSEFIMLLALSSDLSSSYCSIKLQTWVQHTAHLIVRPVFLILVIWSSDLRSSYRSLIFILEFLIVLNWPRFITMLTWSPNIDSS
jgi:hypothetical protein